jgi:RNA polymerase sigma-70 factor (ECF subfamily)
MILAAADRQAQDHREALERLVSTYWRSVYALYRGMGLGADAAADMTQEFFARIMETDWLSRVDPERGRFRTYLRTCARNFLADQRDRAAAAKRGGGVRHYSIDFDEAERMLEPAGGEPPERAFDRSWALDLLQSAIQQLEGEMRARGQDALFRAVRSAFALDGPPEAPTHARIARELGVSESDVAQFLYRARRRLREIIRERVRATVETESQVDDEIRALFDALAR